MDFDATTTGLRAALAVNPYNLPLRLHLAQLLMEHGQAAAAQAEYRTALGHLKVASAQKPADPTIYDQLAEVLTALGDTVAAATNVAIAAALRGGAAPATPAAPTPREPRPAPPDEAITLAGLRLGAQDEPLDPADELAERPGITFANVGGLEDLKERIRMAIIYPVQRPELFAAYGKQAGGGLLLYGPPGCGKTYLARATAGEVGARFLTIGISDILDMWQGRSEQKLHAIFETARQHTPTVLFFDEVEAIGGNRLDMRQHFQRTLVNQFLAELDGAAGDNAGILIIGATNSPWHVDSALRRPGRFDKVVFVAPPDEAARRAILQLHLLGKPADAVDVARLAKDTEGWSGADLRALVDTAADEAITAALRGGALQPLTTALLQRALRSHKATTVEWLSTAKNYALYSNEGGLYDEVAAYLKKRKLLH